MTNSTDQLLRAIMQAKTTRLSEASKREIRSAASKTGEQLLVMILHYLMCTKLMWIVLDNRPSEEKVALIQFLIDAINDEMGWRYVD